MRLGKYEAWLTCDGEPLPEYSSTSTQRAVSCLVPSKAGQAFVLRYRNHSGRDLVRFDVRMDGSPAGKRVCWPRQKGSTSGIRTGPETMQAFQFSSLVTTDDDDAPNLDDDGRIGVIHVSVMRISRKDRVKHSAPSHRKPEFRSVGVVHERSKKAGAHCVSLGQARQVDPVNRNTNEWRLSVDRRAAPLATFTFQYKPKAVLQAEGVIPLDQTSRSTDDYKRPIEEIEWGGAENRPLKRFKSTTGVDDIVAEQEVIEILYDDDDIELVKNPDEHSRRSPERTVKTERDICCTYPVLENGVIDLTQSE